MGIGVLRTTRITPGKTADDRVAVLMAGCRIIP
jgi:hypothetical protein